MKDNATGLTWQRRPGNVTFSFAEDLRNWESFRGRLSKANIDYLVIGERETLPNRYGFAFTAGKNEYPFCRRLADEYGQRVAQYGAMQLYRIRPEAVPALPAPAQL